MNTPSAENFAEVIVRETRKPTILLNSTDDASTPGSVSIIGLPKDYTQTIVDLEHLMPNPRAAKGHAKMTDTASFLAFVARHATEQTVVWCDIDPVASRLKFVAVLDDHATNAPGWRRLTSTYEPEQSVELRRWMERDTKRFSQLEFAEHLERNQEDIASPAGQNLPSSLDMLKMATEFEANADRRCKSAIRLSSGGVNLTFVDDETSETVARMTMFERFGLGLPVFRGEDAFFMLARLRYQARDSKVSFVYELLRADKIFEAAAKSLIEKVRLGLGPVPMLMGSFA